MTIPLFIIGAGGFGREVYSIVEAIAESGGARYEAVFIDDSPSPANAGRVHRLGSEIVGDVGFLVGARESCAAIIAVGSAADRSALAFRLLGAPVTFPSLTHPDSTVGLGVDLSEGVVIAAGARLSTNIDIGRHVHIDQNAVVGHDATLGDYCRLGPQACISGNVSIGQSSGRGQRHGTARDRDRQRIHDWRWSRGDPVRASIENRGRRTGASARLMRIGEVCLARRGASCIAWHSGKRCSTAAQRKLPAHLLRHDAELQGLAC